MRRPRGRGVGLLALLVVFALVAACGGDGGTDTTAAGGTDTTAAGGTETTAAGGTDATDRDHGRRTPRRRPVPKVPSPSG